LSFPVPGKERKERGGMPIHINLPYRKRRGKGKTISYISLSCESKGEEERKKGEPFHLLTHPRGGTRERKQKEVRKREKKKNVCLL